MRFGGIVDGSPLRDSCWLFANTEPSEHFIKNAVADFDTAQLRERVRAGTELDRDDFRRASSAPALEGGGKRNSCRRGGGVLALGGDQRMFAAFVIGEAGDLEHPTPQGREPVAGLRG